jgi:tetratricopeptide (TPR) repeat protein
MKLRLALMLLLTFAQVSWPAELRNEFEAGRQCYIAGEFKKAAAHFGQAVDADPNNADSYFWLGKSYEVLADIGAPLGGGRSSSRARTYLAKAVELAPNEPEYRHELFAFLLDWADRSRTALADAESVLRTMSPSDPDYPFMRLQWQQQRNTRASVDFRLGSLFLLAPRQSLRALELPASAFLSRHSAVLSPDRCGD